MNVAKLNILKDTFGKEFNINRFKQFTREFFNEPEMLPETKRIGIWKEYQEHINSYYTVAKYTDVEANNLIVVAVELKRNTSIDRARSMQRNFISKVLDENNLEAAIVAFYTEDEPSWRLSFVRLDYTFTDKGIELDVTPAKRYSYLIGASEPNHTAQSQLLNIFSDDKSNPTLNEIEEAFSVETVTKEFFSKYKEKYFKLKEHLENDDGFKLETEKLGFELEKFSEQFAKKLMGQLAFLYFLQKKGWLGVRIMPKNQEFEINAFKKIYNEQDEYHKDVLKRTFRQTQDGKMKLLSTELFKLNEHEAGLLSDCFVDSEYDVGWGYGNKTFIREIFDFCINSIEKNFFDDYLEPFFYQALNNKRRNHYFKLFNCKIPFLNGGLFEPLEGYNWKDVKFEIPNELFSNIKEKGREADGILDIFDRFNFTMNEAEPLDKEVAVDPEMLGKIFENLLDVKDRKSKGAFYTPREIVHYMCQESLVNYLVNEVDVPYEDMKEFILYGELIRDADGRADVGYGKAFTIKTSILDNIVEIDEALKNVKVADPAVGSGAFPLGMLNEIVSARNNITEYIIRKDKEGAFERRFGESFIRKWRSAYKMKWDTIKNSIFAVDIEPSAVDITKLRLWLSVVVEQEIDEENLEPHPLPNLDMNIHVGDSLIDEYEGIRLFDKSILLKSDKNKRKRSGKMVEQLRLLFDSDEVLEEVFDKQNQYFDETNENNKKALKARIDVLQDELIIYKLRESRKNEALNKYNDIKNNKSKPYFIWELEFAKVFREKGGFDIVIGNPPYIDSEEMTKNLLNTREVCKNKYSFAKGNWDIYIVFFELGYNLLNAKGVQTYITPDKWISRPFGVAMREQLKENIHTILKAGRDVFETATVDAIITLITKRNTEFINIYEFTNKNIVLKRKVSNQILSYPYTLDILFSDYIDIITKINANESKLKKYYLCESACATSDAYKLKPYISNIQSLDDYSSKHMKMINTGTIDQYTMRWGKKEMTYLKDKYLYPVVDKEIFIEEFANSYSRKSIKPKLIIKGLTLLDASIDLKGEVIPGKSTLLISHNNGQELKYLAAFINSKLAYFYIKEKYASSSYNGGINFNKDMINNLPYTQPSDSIKREIVEWVENIVKIKEDDDYMNDPLKRLEVSNYQEKIDSHIYKLYNLTEDEMGTIEEACIKK